MDTPNVVYITIDSLRADHTACLDYDQAVDPRLRELCEQGTMFRKAVANGPNTTASFPSILTGAHSLTYGPYGVCGGGSPFLSRTLNEAGYQTVGYHSNPHLGEDQGYPTGFDTFNDAVEGEDSVVTLKDKVERLLSTDTILYRFLRRAWHYFSMTTTSSAYARADTISDNAIEWINAKRSDNDPFFIWLHYMDVHYPFQPPKTAMKELSFSPISKRRIVDLNGKMQERPEDLTEKDVTDLLKLYDAEIRYTDQQIGRVIDALKTSGILDETIVVVTADHGEAFGEHDRFGHHPYPYDELIRVPLAIAGPGIEPTTVDQQVSLLDLPPTVLDLVDVEIPETMEGESFAPAVSGDHIEERTAMTISDNGTIFGCRTEEWKYITRVDDEESYLFNLAADPDETKNVIAEATDVADRFEAVIAEYRDGIDRAATTANVEYSSETQERLADLGYLDK
ncbi:MAG: sulfatase [Halodesulfurarchaeum sp.]|nr:sulfatase [Halodesulfurarchaeum sp.]